MLWLWLEQWWNKSELSPGPLKWGFKKSIWFISLPIIIRNLLKLSFFFKNELNTFYTIKVHAGWFSQRKWIKKAHTFSKSTAHDRHAACATTHDLITFFFKSSLLSLCDFLFQVHFFSLLETRSSCLTFKTNVEKLRTGLLKVINCSPLVSERNSGYFRWLLKGTGDHDSNFLTNKPRGQVAVVVNWS